MDNPVSTLARPMDKVFMMEENELVNEPNVSLILESGHSRIPIHSHNDKNALLGILLVKKLALEYQGDLAPLKQFGEMIHAQPIYFPPELNILAALNQFQKGKSHMAFIKVERTGQLTGMITLEDVMEALIQEPIGDETD